MAPYNLSFRIEFVKFGEYGPMDVGFTVLNLPVEGGPLKYGYTDYSAGLMWLADWSGMPFTQWTQAASWMGYSKEVEGKTYRFNLAPLIPLRGLADITERTETYISYSIFVPNTVIDIQVLQDKIESTTIINFLNQTEFDRVYAQGERYRNEVLENASAEVALKLDPYGLTAADFEVSLSERYSALGVHYTIQGAVEMVREGEYRVDLKFLNITMSELTVSSQTPFETVLRYTGDAAGDKVLVMITCKSFHRIEDDVLYCSPKEILTTTVTSTTTKTSRTTSTSITTVTSETGVEPRQPSTLYTYLPTSILDNSEFLAAASWIGLAGALIWRGYVRSVWSRSHFDYDVFRLLVRMKGGRTRVNLLESLEEPKNKLQLAKELKMDWKAVDRHIEILLKHSLITESDSIGNVKYYSLTPNGREILQLLDELGNVEKK